MVKKNRKNTELESGNRIRFVRTALDMSQDDLAALLHVSRQEISNYENGNRPITIDKALILANHFKVNLDYLFCNDSTEYAQLFLPCPKADSRAALYQDVLLDIYYRAYGKKE